MIREIFLIVKKKNRPTLDGSSIWLLMSRHSDIKNTVCTLECDVGLHAFTGEESSMHDPAEAASTWTIGFEIGNAYRYPNFASPFSFFWRSDPKSLRLPPGYCCCHGNCRRVAECAIDRVDVLGTLADWNDHGWGFVWCGY